METSEIIKFAISGVLTALFFILRCVFSSKDKTKETKEKKKNKPKTLATLGLVVSAWYLIGTAISYFSGLGSELEVEFEMFSERVDIFGFSVAGTTVLSYLITVVVLVLALAFRLIAFPKFKDKPGKLQNLIEAAVEECTNFTENASGGLGETLSSYMMALAVFMVFSAATELFGQRAPTSDLIVTLSMSLITFFLINYYGIKKKKLSGRLLSFTKPTPLVTPFKLISDIATPVSLACRLFGNMLGGMIVMELLKSSLGAYAVGIPAVAGLYFNLFHPLIQTYIFVILSLTFINEAAE